ncbi:MAG: penicillin-binding protein 2 [Candidatus Falkowbacteria bacterium]|nr:penicillin-binding protein 2 [Candidatus Falkowbacteria bacterium]
MSYKFLKNARTGGLLKSLREQKEDPFLVKEGKFNFGGLKDPSYQTDWTEESFLADSSRKEMVSRSFNFSQIRYFTLFGIFVLGVLIVRAGWLQIGQNDYYSLLSENNRLRAEVIEPKRGIIYTRDLEPLVRNKANFVLYFKPIDLPGDELVRDDLLRRLSRIIEGGATTTTNILSAGTDGMSVVSDNATFYQLKDILSKVKMGSLESYQSLGVADNIEYDKAMLIALDLPQWPGVFLSSKIRREYLVGAAVSSPEVPGASSLAHILGYTGKIDSQELKSLSADYSPIDYIGKMGIEYFWEKELKGRPGKKNIEVDAFGRQKKIINEEPAQDGVNLQLSLDLGLQKKAEEVTTAYLNQAGLHRASVIIMNPKNGEILTLVSLPGYDNNAFARGISQDEFSRFLDDPNLPLLNRAVSGEFPAGSTIKPIFAAGALEEKIINETTSFISSGGLRVGEWFFPDWKAGGHGVVNVRQALAWSVNTFFYYIGGGYGDFKGLGVEGLVKYARLFGLGEITGVDLPGEQSGFVPTASWKEAVKNESWYIGDTYHFAIGQGDVLVTPLQVANYNAAIANGGTLYTPHLVSKILGEDNKVIREIVPNIIRQNFISPANLEIVREGMRAAVTLGSASSLNALPVKVAGKTGTAQWSTKKAAHAWFIGFAPYDDPEIAITVLVEEGVEGSTIAVPIAKDILSWYYSGRR